MSTTELTDRMLTGERILWSGRPAQGLWFTGRDVFLIPFSLLWGGFAIFWEVSALTQTKTDVFMSVWGVPFVLLGLYFIAGRFLVDAWIRGGIFYAITNKRILISRSWPFGKFTALSLERLPDANLSESSGGRGTIRFGEAAQPWGGRNNMSSLTPSLDPTPQFIGIDNARSVFDQIQLASRSGDSSSSVRSRSTVPTRPDRLD